jgi:hypothetical protein
MRTLAFVLGLGTAAVGVWGYVEPSFFMWLARHRFTSGQFYAVAAFRVAFGFLLISAA